MQTVREEGIAYNDNEQMPGLRGVGCPIYSGDRLIGAIGIGAPAARICGEFFREEVPNLLSEAANEIELNLSEPILKDSIV
jgi:DNA-binding IclR family transcriptional regulator